MTIIKELLSEERLYHYGSNRMNLWLGNVARYNEQENGERVGHEIGFSIELGDHIGEFDVEGAIYLTRGFSITLGRYGFSIWWRGRQITREDQIPRWQIGNPDYA